MRFKKILIIGVGFMGASLAAAIKDKNRAVKISAFARNKKSFNKIKKIKPVDYVSSDLKEVVSWADLIILATPVTVIGDYLKKIKPYLKEDAVVIDLGSTKEQIHKWAKNTVSKKANFVGCHPLCGSQKSGPFHADKHLYRGAVCIITTKGKYAKMVEDFWAKLGCKVYKMTPKRHDEILSQVSHLPHVLSFMLTKIVNKNNFRYVAGSFKDMTRISLSPSSVWSDIFISNSKNIKKSINGFIKELVLLKGLIEKKDKAKLMKLIDGINTKQKDLKK